jgi:hypothetical protein
MNHFQQNKFNQLISVTILNVTFNYILIDSNINRLLTDLKVAYEEFNRHIEFKSPEELTRSQAIKVNSLMRVLMDSTDEVKNQNQIEFIKNVILSSISIITSYDNAIKSGLLDFKLRDDLINETTRYFNIRLGHFLNSDFWDNLRIYEWLAKEGFIKDDDIHSIYYKKHEKFFSDKELEDFFAENRTHIIRKMLKCKSEYDETIYMKNPLKDEQVKLSFDLHNQMPKITQKINP